MSNSLRPHGLQPPRLPRPCFPSKATGMGTPKRLCIPYNIYKWWLYFNEHLIKPTYQIKYSYLYWKEFLNKAECVTYGRLLLEFSSGNRDRMWNSRQCSWVGCTKWKASHVLAVLGGCFLYLGANADFVIIDTRKLWIDVGNKIIRNPWAISERAFNSVTQEKGTVQFSECTYIIQSANKT